VESLSKTELLGRASYIEHNERVSAGLQPNRTDPPPAPFPGRPQSGHFNVGTPGQASYEVELSELSSPGTGSRSGVLHAAAPPQDNARAWLLALLLLFIALAGVGLLIFAILHTKGENEGPVPEPSSQIGAPSSHVAPPGTVTLPGSRSASAPSASASTAASASPLSGSSASAASASPSASGASTAPTGWGAVPQLSATVHPLGPGPGPTPKGKPACDPPFTLDAQGHRHYKPECPLE
jgi:serine/threonine-protein kinase